MPNTSATGGYLTPAATPAVLEGLSLNAFLHDLIAGVTGLDATLVRPSWQPEPPNLPQAGTTWCAFGVQQRTADFDAYVTHNPAGDGVDNLARHENLDVLTSFFSTTHDDADLNCEYLREGLQIAQNREQLQLAGWGLIETGDATPAPTLVKELWLYRTDMTCRFRRLIQRTYPVLSLLSANGTLYTDVPATTTPMIITNPRTL